ncbi:unnamed protein product [Closterium sp. NIES-65]|nr:unnamed protein product [Closterium sp. NIES-65]
MNSKMNSMMLLLRAVKWEVEAGSRVKQEQRESNEGAELKGGLDELVTPGMGETGVQAPGMRERGVQAEVRDEGRHRDELSESGRRFLEEVVEEYSREMEQMGKRKKMGEREETEEVESTKGDVERLRNVVAGRAEVEEEREISINSLRKEVEGLKCDSRYGMKCLDELRAEMKAEMAVLVAQRERIFFGKLDELRVEMEEGRAEEVGRMRELREVENEKAEVAERLSEMQHRVEEGRMEASTLCLKSSRMDRLILPCVFLSSGISQCWAVREAL